MQLISPKFLQSCDLKRAKILQILFKDDDVFRIVMEKKDINFEDACYWIAEEVFGIDPPLASPSEIEIMKLAAREFVDQNKKNP